VIVGAAFCPHPPALVPELAGNAAGELADLRAACTSAVARVAALGAPLIVLGPDAVSVSHSPLCRGSLAGFGLPMELHLGAPTCGGELDLPLSLTIGAWLVRAAIGPRSGARGFSVGPDFAATRAAVEALAIAEYEDVALLVMGDGSARRTTTAPGYFDPRSETFDASVSSALAAGDCAALQDLDPQLGADLLASGVGTWRAAASLLDGARYEAHLRYDDAPYGVGYLVAEWTLRA
jgi:hypothetical protein